MLPDTRFLPSAESSVGSRLPNQPEVLFPDSVVVAGPTSKGGQRSWASSSLQAVVYGPLESPNDTLEARSRAEKNGSWLYYQTAV